ncbi:class I SAM-dependent methyltransferase [Paenibacillus sabinae]|uniref:Type 11 methyltransferase n=1 Tax=Paenibacillus sabinae T27 TaxID=1268072 RepID=X5A2Q9_9BACL|nr:class I SAM-dependent methyltransferase [Paenibacillus sabinae]AHV98638.1 type 11 methyltransferase [Paenibacillus sabinae T27]
MDNEVRDFYDSYGAREWNRLEENAYSRINYFLHMHFVEKYLQQGMKVLDAGCGAGRYSIEFAKRGCHVTLFDVSNVQLALAEEKTNEANVKDNIDGFIQGDIRDLSSFKDGQFDMVVCYGAPLSYVLDNRAKAILEFNRVLNKKGLLFVSVNNKWGILKMLLGHKYPDFFNNPEYWFIDQVMKTGDLPRHEKVSQPPRHFFEAAELNHLLEENGFGDIVLGGSPCFSSGNAGSVQELSLDEKALDTILQIEIEMYTKPTMVDCGEFLLARAIKKQAEE